MVADLIYDSVKRATVDGIKESRKLLVGIFVEALAQQAHADDEDEEDDIPYNYVRFQRFKLILELITPILVILVAIAIFIASSPDIGWTLAATFVAATLVLAIIIGLDRAKDRAAEHDAALSYWWSLTAILTVGVIGFVHMQVVKNMGAAQSAWLITTVIMMVAGYYIGRQIFCWKNHTIKRDGSQMTNHRQGSIFWLVSGITSSVNVGEVNCNLHQNSFDQIIGTYTVNIDGAPKGDEKYWGNMHWILDGEQLRASVMQRKK